MVVVKREFSSILPMPLFIQVFCGRKENTEIKTQQIKATLNGWF